MCQPRVSRTFETRQIRALQGLPHVLSDYRLNGLRAGRDAAKRSG